MAMFGSTNFGAGSSLFGAATPTFGAPSAFSAGSASSPFTFGASSTLTQPTPTFGGANPFGASPASTPNLFSLSSASKPATSTPLFGATTTAPAFGAPTTTNLFGGAAGATPTFGATPAFGATAKSGTGDPKFAPTSGRDAGGAVIHQTITAMPAYEAKSFEELRFEDYAAGRKGAQQQAGAGLFGATTAMPTTTGLFGASQPATTAFGLPSTTSTPSSSFSLFGAPAASTSTGLFAASQPAPTSSLFSGLGAGSGSSLFGGSLTSPTTTSAFGAATTAPAFGGSLFGGGTTSAFGSTPAASTGFSLGGSLAAPTFSLGGDTGSSLFGGSSSAFGTTSSLFGGAPAASSSSSLFGGSSSSLFSGLGGGAGTGGGLTFNLGTSSPSTTSSLFGTSSSTPNFSLGSLGSTSSLFSPSSSSSLFGATGGSTTSSLFGGSLFGGTTASTEPHLISTIQSNPYGTLPSIAPSKDSDLAGLGALKSPAKKPIKPQPHYKLTPRSAAKIQPRGYGKKLSVFDDQPSSFTPSSKVVASPDIFQSRLKLTIDPEAEMPEVTPVKLKKQTAAPPQSPYAPATNSTQPIPILQITSPSGEAKEMPATPIVSKVSKSTEPTTPTVTDPANGSLMATPTPKRVTPGTVQHITFEDQDDKAMSTKAYPSYAAFSTENNISITKSPTITESSGADKNKRKDYLPILTKPGYYTHPEYDDLCAMTAAELGGVKEFTVGRTGYGRITFRGETDVRGLNLDEIIVFQPHQIEVYPDGTEKPPVGEGLNKPAVVTLERCWPKDPRTGKMIKEPSRRVERFIKKLRVRSGTKFVNYHVKTGEWSFEVDSF